MKVAVLGAGGLLGRAILDELQGTETIALPRAACDIGVGEEVRAKTAGVALIINCAAFTNVDGAEKDEEGAYRTNTLGAENVARAAAKHGAKLVHVSTDFVFDGADPEPYDELARPNPQSIYARTKWAGEELATRRPPAAFRGARARALRRRRRQLLVQAAPAHRRRQGAQARRRAPRAADLGALGGTADHRRRRER